MSFWLRGLATTDARTLFKSLSNMKKIRIPDSNQCQFKAIRQNVESLASIAPDDDYESWRPQCRMVILPDANYAPPVKGMYPTTPDSPAEVYAVSVVTAPYPTR